ncbi:hypothetical protein P9X10_02585 [Bacillus cereus]|nr:hypothetical protein [Bacillus cereus]
MDYLNTIPAETSFYVYGSIAGAITLLLVVLKLRNLYTVSKGFIGFGFLLTGTIFLYNYLIIQKQVNLFSLPFIGDIARIFS